MFEELVSYWKDSDNHIHPNDNCLINANIENKEIKEEYKLHTNLYAEPYMGSLSDPKIVFLYLNPGYHKADDAIQKTKIGDALINVLRQSLNDTEFPFLWLDADYKDTPKEKNPGAFYWNRLIDQKTGTSFLKRLANARWEGNETEARIWIANNICDIELFPYHSIKFNYKWLDYFSVKMAREAVINAIEKKPDTLFVFMRSFALWIPEERVRQQIENDYENVIINKAVRNPSLRPNLIPKNGGTSVGNRILDFLLPRIGEPKE